MFLGPFTDEKPEAREVKIKMQTQKLNAQRKTGYTLC